MKKLLASLLAIVMALSLAAPAFADSVPFPDPGPVEVPPSGWTADVERAELAARLGIPVEADDYYLDDETWEWIAAHEEETKEFLVNPDVYAKWYLQDSLKGISEYYGVSLDGTVLWVLESWVMDQLANEYGAAHPELADQFRANAYDFFAQKYAWYDTPENYMAERGITEEEFLDRMVMSQLSLHRTRQAELTEFEVSHPGMLARFEANAYDYFAQTYYWWDSAEEYMKDYG